MSLTWRRAYWVHHIEARLNQRACRPREPREPREIELEQDIMLSTSTAIPLRLTRFRSDLLQGALERVFAFVGADSSSGLGELVELAFALLRTRLLHAV